MKKVIARGKRNKTLNEVKPVENINRHMKIKKVHFIIKIFSVENGFQTFLFSYDKIRIHTVF